MSNITATIITPIETYAGATAVNYTPLNNQSPILAMHCVASSGTGIIKLTPLRATDAVIGATAGGTGARFRFIAGPTGAISAVEIANAGSGYIDGPVIVELVDPYGTGGSIAATASGGVITSASIVAGGSNYSGYISLGTNDFIEGVTYDIIPRYVELTTGGGAVTLLGYRMSTRPYLVF